MKLRLNKALRAAVLSCGAAALSCGVAQADYVWKTNADGSVPTISTKSWRNSANWNCTGSTTWPAAANKGPGEPDSSAWDKIVINNGASGTVADLEGWCLQLSVLSGTLTVDNVRKLQGGAVFEVGDSSSLTIDFKEEHAGNDGGTVAINLTGSGAMTMNLYNNKGGDTTTVNYGQVAAGETRGVFTLTGQGGARTYNSLVFAANIGSTVSETTTLHTLTLASISNVTVSSVAYNIGGNFLNSGSTEALTASNENIGLYSIVHNDTDGTYKLYYVTGREQDAVKTLSLTEGGSEKLLSEYGAAFGGKLQVTVTRSETDNDAAILTVDRNFALGTLAASGGALRVDINEGNTLELGATESEEGASITFGVSGTLHKIGSGEVTISNLSQSTGTLTVQEGTVTLGSESGTWAGNINVDTNGTLAYAGGTKTLSQGGTIADGAHINTLDGATLTLTKAITTAPIFNIAEGTTLKVTGAGTVDNSQFTGAGTLQFDAAANTRSIGSVGNSFTGTLEIVNGTFSLGTVGNASARDTTADFSAAKVLVHSGAIFQTNNGAADAPTNIDGSTPSINSKFFAASGSTLKNLDGHSKWNGEIHLNVSDLSNTDTPQYNAQGEMSMSMYWAKHVVWDALVKGNGTLNIEGVDSDTGGTHRLVLNNNENTFQGTYHLKGKTGFLMELYLNKANAAEDATINVEGTDQAGKTNLLVGADNAVIAGLKGTGNGAVKADGNAARTLIINQSSITEFAGSIANGSGAAEVLSITKQSEGTLTLSGENTYSGATTVTGGTLKVTGSISNTSSAAVSDKGMLEISGTNASVTAGGITATAKNGQVGKAKNVTIDASGISGATSGEGESMQALGEMTSLTLEFTAAASISNVKLRDVTLSGGNLTLSGVKAIASTVAEPSQRTMALSAAADAGSADTQTLTATPVVQNATYKGDLTVDIDDAILSPANAGKDFKWFIFDNVTLEADGSFTLNLGKNLTDMLRNGQPTVTLSGGWVNDEGKSSVELTYDDLVKLHTGEGGLLAGSVTTGGDLVLTVTNIPEPTTGTLSVLALAALAARRRRK